MPDYSKGLIYTIRNREDDTKIYVGSTIQPLYKRFHQHKIHSTRENIMNKLLYIEVNGDWDNWYIELYENYPCSCREELHKKEGEIIRLIGTLNKNIAGRDGKQYRIDNADKIKEQYKQYRFENADIIKERKNQYRIDNADKIKQYYIENADKIKEQNKQYRINNADKIKEYQQQYHLKKKEEKLQKLCKTTA